MNPEIVANTNNAGILTVFSMAVGEITNLLNYLTAASSAIFLKRFSNSSRAIICSGLKS